MLVPVGNAKIPAGGSLFNEDETKPRYTEIINLINSIIKDEQLYGHFADFNLQI